MEVEALGLRGLVPFNRISLLINGILCDDLVILWENTRVQLLSKYQNACPFPKFAFELVWVGYKVTVLSI